jgi:hypothetical protein
MLWRWKNSASSVCSEDSRSVELHSCEVSPRRLCCGDGRTVRLVFFPKTVVLEDTSTSITLALRYGSITTAVCRFVNLVLMQALTVRRLRTSGRNSQQLLSGRRTLGFRSWRFVTCVSHHCHCSILTIQCFAHQFLTKRSIKRAAGTPSISVCTPR